MVTLAECRPGLFEFDGRYYLKTGQKKGFWRWSAYDIETGEDLDAGDDDDIHNGIEVAPIAAMPPKADQPPKRKPVSAEEYDRRVAELHAYNNNQVDIIRALRGTLADWVRIGRIPNTDEVRNILEGACPCTECRGLGKTEQEYEVEEDYSTRMVRETVVCERCGGGRFEPEIPF